MTVLGGVGEWRGTADQLKKVTALVDTQDYRNSPNFKLPTDRAIKNFRPRASGA